MFLAYIVNSFDDALLNDETSRVIPANEKQHALRLGKKGVKQRVKFPPKSVMYCSSRLRLYSPLILVSTQLKGSKHRLPVN